MKKISLVFVSLLIVSMIVFGCKKNTDSPDTGGNGGNEPTPVTKVSYKIDTAQGTYPALDCFKYHIVYYVGENDSVVVDDATAPWVSEKFEVTKPFKAKFNGYVTYNLDDIPDDTPFSISYKLYIYENDYAAWTSGKKNDFVSKANFIEYISTHPTALIFRGIHNVE